jgi:hypothetical protein
MLTAIDLDELSHTGPLMAVKFTNTESTFAYFEALRQAVGTLQ